MSTCVVHVVRHGQVHNPDSVFYGRIEGFRLADIGTEQAQRCGQKLESSGAAKEIDAFFSSPQLRAKQTVENIITGMSESVTTTDYTMIESFNEIQSPLQGVSIADCIAINWDLYNPECIKKILGEVPPFETFEEAYARTKAGIAELATHCTAKGYKSVLVTTHGACILSAKLLANNIPATKRAEILEQENDFYPKYCSVISLTVDSEGNIISHSEIVGEATDSKKV